MLELLGCSAAGLREVTAAPPPACRASDFETYMLSSDDDNSITSSALRDVASVVLPAVPDGRDGAFFVAVAMGNGADLLGISCEAKFSSAPCPSSSLELVDITLLRRFGVEVLPFGDSHLRISFGFCSDIVTSDCIVLLFR